MEQVGSWLAVFPSCGDADGKFIDAGILMVPEQDLDQALLGHGAAADLVKASGD
ncbi:hypothetical protein SAE02_75390 [Skermanella aerolata]|uniref:Uncharacterized protein n=1 Tax=Skermanella aerolata TaxID=393310 RepID=A0A512E3R7_9PROT|nr:hypothetical protein SAE02_75390 [Skermanella aerolata]